MNSSNIPIVAAALTIVVGLLVLSGWILDVPVLRTLVSGQVSMKANTAIGFTCCGLLLMVATASHHRVFAILRWVLVLPVCLIALATLAQYLFDVDLQIDELIAFAVDDTIFTSSPGRMAPTTAIGFLLFAAALSIDHWQTGIARGLSRSLTTLLLLIALTSIMGYAYGAPALYLGIDGVTAMSMPTAVLFLALGLGAVWLHPHYGFPAMLTERSIVGTHIRSLLPMIIGAPLLVGAAVAAGYGRVYEGQFAIALTSLGSIVAAAIVGIVSIVVLRRADRALLMRERALAATSNGVIITDHLSPDEPIVFVNRAFSDMTGYAGNEALGRNCRFLNERAGDQATTMDNLRQCIRNGESGEFELRNHRKDGSEFWNRLTLAPVGNYEAKVTHYVGVIHDVTETRKREKQLENALAQARDANAMRDTFVRLASHELRTPLNAALTWIRLMDVDTSQKTRDRGLEVVSQSIESQSRLIDDLVDVTRFSSAGVRLETEMSNVVELLKTTIEELRPAIEIEHAIRVDAPDEPIMADVDPLRVQQIVRNLVTNAHKYTPAGGSIEISLQKDQDHFVLTVKDTGVGLGTDELERVFEPFWRGESHQPGLGVGLAIASSLVAAHGGSIEATSDGPDRGSQFCVRIPFSGTQSGRFMLASDGTAFDGASDEASGTTDNPISP